MIVVGNRAKALTPALSRSTGRGKEAGKGVIRKRWEAGHGFIEAAEIVADTAACG